MKSPKWFRDICDESNIITQEPYALTIDGQPWSIVTDGRVLVAMRGLYDDLREPPEKHQKDFKWMLTAFNPSRGISVSLGELRTWVEVEKALHCPFCGGSGLRDDVDIEEGGPCEKWIGQNPGWLAGAFIGRARLRLPLYYCTSESGMVNVQILPELEKEKLPGMYPLCIESDAMRIIIMPMREAKHEGIPVFNAGTSEFIKEAEAQFATA